MSRSAPPRTRRRPCRSKAASTATASPRRSNMTSRSRPAERPSDWWAFSLPGGTSLDRLRLVDDGETPAGLTEPIEPEQRGVAGHDEIDTDEVRPDGRLRASPGCGRRRASRRVTGLRSHAPTKPPPLASLRSRRHPRRPGAASLGRTRGLACAQSARFPHSGRASLVGIVRDELFKCAHDPLPFQPGRGTKDFLSCKRTAP